MKLKSSLTIIVLLIYNSVFAQQAKIPIEIFEENAVLLNLSLNDNKEPLLFFFDTGATNSLIDSTAAVKLGMKCNYEQEVAGASGSKMYKFILNQSVHIHNNIRIDSTNFVIENLSRLQESLGKKFVGIIGYDILKSFKTKIDFDAQQMELYSFKDSIKTEGYSKINFNFNNDITIPQFPVTIQLKNGKSYTDTILFDSGAGLTLLLNTPFKEKHNLTKQIGNVLESSSQNLTSETITTEAVIKSIQIGEYTFGESSISLSSDVAGVSSYPNYLGILGAVYINRFNVILDYSKKQLYLKPNLTYSKKFKFPVIGIKLEEVNGDIIISDINSKTPAFKKGLRKNQKILSINGFVSKNVKEYKKVLEKENDKVKIKVLQIDGKIKTIKIKLKRLI